MANDFLIWVQRQFNKEMTSSAGKSDAGTNNAETVRYIYAKKRMNVDLFTHKIVNSKMDHRAKCKIKNHKTASRNIHGFGLGNFKKLLRV